MRCLSIACVLLFAATGSCNLNPAEYCEATCHCIPEDGGACPDFGNRKFTSEYADIRNQFQDEMRLKGDKPELHCEPYSAVAARTGEELCPGPTPDADDENYFCAFKYKCGTEEEDIVYELKEIRKDDSKDDHIIVKTHEGPCGVCSSAQDLAAFLDPSLSFKAITVCGLPFAMPHFLGFLANDAAFKLAAAAVTECFIKEFGFTDSCAKLWGSNSVNSIMSCTAPCLGWLEDCIPAFTIPVPGFGEIAAPNIASEACPDTCPSNPISCFPDGAGGGCPPFAGCSPDEPECPCFNSLVQTNGEGDGSCELNECLKCDDVNSGDIFNYWSGRTRRNSGILTSAPIPGTPFYMGLKRPCNAIANIEQVIPPTQSCPKPKTNKKGSSKTSKKLAEQK